jgi:LysM repeat protein
LEFGVKTFVNANHLQNVLVTISDKKLGVSANNTTIDYYTADVVTANDYYPGGMNMPGRKFSQGNSKYRYSINGQEKESELNENITTAEFWEYDSRIVRRWNVDPVVKVDESPYATFRNNPVVIVDPSGEDGEPYKVKKGDNLSKIAKRFGTTVSLLAKINGLKNPNDIKAGQILTVGSLPTPAIAQQQGPNALPPPLTNEQEQKQVEAQIEAARSEAEAYKISYEVNNWNSNIGPSLAMMTNAVAEYNAPYQTGGAWGEVNSGANNNGAGNTAWTRASPNSTSSPNSVGSGIMQRVGQWMSPEEYTMFSKTGEIPRTNVLTRGPAGYEKTAKYGDLYVEFDINKTLLRNKSSNGNGWALIKSKNQMDIKLAAKKGQTLLAPVGTNIEMIKIKSKQ